MKDTIFNHAGFSHSFYWTSSVTKGDTVNFMVNNNDYPTRQFNSIDITEYNCFSSTEGTNKRDSLMNSPYYVHRLIDLLTFMYDKPLNRVFIYPFCELTTADGESGKMGIWYKIPNTIQFMPKPSKKMFYDFWEVVRYGYTVIPNGIKGRDKSVVKSGNGYVIRGNCVVATEFN